MQARPPPSPWRDFDEATREREYSPSSCIGGNYQAFVAAYSQRSAQARAATPGHLNLRYGPGAAQRLDLFVPPGAAGQRAPPLLVFIHGGYWQELSKDDSSFAAPDCVRQGIAFAALDYTLAPAATVQHMVDECTQALTWLQAHAGAWGFDPQRMAVAGSSAGAHLAAMAAMSANPAAARAGNRCCVRAAVLVSGIYELEPLVGTSINGALALTAHTAQAVSPALQPLAGFPPSIVCWGAVETAEFKRQGQDFSTRLRAAGCRCDMFEVPARNHFDVIFDLVDPATVLGAATLTLMRSL